MLWKPPNESFNLTFIIILHLSLIVNNFFKYFKKFLSYLKQFFYQPYIYYYTMFKFDCQLFFIKNSKKNICMQF